MKYYIDDAIEALKEQMIVIDEALLGACDDHDELEKALTGLELDIDDLKIQRKTLEEAMSFLEPEVNIYGELSKDLTEAQKNEIFRSR